jgi:hypothetical protein
MTQTECICGKSNIRHAFHNKWKCESCGRFHDAAAMERLAERTQAEGDA